MGTVPVIIYHEGSQATLKICVEHTKRYNKRVVLLGDKSNRDYCAEWYDADLYEIDSRWSEFLQWFQNYSFYTDTFVKQVFKRLFIIERFIEEKKIEKFALIDSDVLLYVDFSKMPYLDEYDAGVVTLKQDYEDYRWVSNIGISFFSKEALNEFISFCIWEYKNNSQELLKKWRWQHEAMRPGGICEMSLAYLWCRNTDRRVMNLAIPYTVEYGIFENAINSTTVYGTEIYKMNRILRIKKIIYKNAIPYYKKSSGSLQRVDGLHFSTFTKQYMKSYSLHEKARVIDYFHALCRMFRSKLKRASAKKHSS